RTTVKIVR
ncbi:hypothetical protein D039_3160B, partial [Vibrio parahaemolyticus EKP-028]